MMKLFFCVGAGLFGLLIGSFLNVVIWRVPRSESLLPNSACPHCGEAVRPWQNVPVISWLALRGKCANCKAPISARYPLIESLTAVGFGLVAWWFVATFGLGALFGVDGVTTPISAWAALAAYLWFVSISIALSAIDFELQRLPDAIVLPSIGVVAGLLSLSAVLGGNWAQLIAVLGGAAALFVFYFVIVLVYPKGMGGGDVKLAPVVGASLGYIGWDAVIVGGFAGFAIGAIVGLVVMAVRRVGRRHALPFGPWMLAGAWLGIVIGPQIMLTYLRLVGLQ